MAAGSPVHCHIKESREREGGERGKKGRGERDRKSLFPLFDCLDRNLM